MSNLKKDALFLSAPILLVIYSRYSSFHCFLNFLQLERKVSHEYNEHEKSISFYLLNRHIYTVKFLTNFLLTIKKQ